MIVSRRKLLGTAIAGGVLHARRARAAASTIRIGVLNDMSGPYRDGTGATSVACVRQAVEDFAALGGGLHVEVVAADHQNKPDIGAAITREWFDRDGVDMLIDVPTSSVALAVNTIAREKNKVYINADAGTTDLAGRQCTPNTIKWSYDTYMLAKSTATATVRAGGDSWFMITANYVFGQQLQRDATRFVTEAGGRVLGAVAYPFPETTDFSPHLLAAQASGAKVIGLCMAGNDTLTCIKQAREFGLGTGETMLAALLAGIQAVRALGPAAGQGLLLTESFYWDLNDRTRAFMKRLAPKTPDNYPWCGQAGCYAGTLHYLKAVAALGADAAKADGAAVVARMKALPYDDDAFGAGTIRADGRALVPAYLFRVKRPEESQGPWDLYALVSTMSGADAAPPLAEGNCPLAPA
jgi:branched-chain amino acid transport system substrate-binding protein